MSANLAVPKANLRTRAPMFGLQLSTYTFRFFLWWIVLFVVIAYIAGIVTGNYMNDEPYSVWTLTIQLGQVFLAIIGGSWLYTLLPSLVSQSMTRREVTRAFTVFAAIFPLIIAVIIIVGRAGEYLMLQALGHEQALVFQSHPASTSLMNTFTTDLVVIPRYYLVFVVGMSIGAMIYRWHGKATFPIAGVITLAVLVIDGMNRNEFASGPSFLDPVFSAINWVPTTGFVIISLGITIALLLTVAKILSDIPIVQKVRS